MVCLDWGGGRGSRVEYIWPKISLFLANSTLLSSTPLFPPQSKQALSSPHLVCVCLVLCSEIMIIWL